LQLPKILNIITSADRKREKYDEFSKSGISEMIAPSNMMSLSYISGDGFPFSTSSPPTIAEKDSFQPIQGKNKLTNK